MDIQCSLCPESSTVWITTRVPLRGQQYTVVPHRYSSDSHAGTHWGRWSEGGCWHLLALSDVTRTLCPVLHDSSNSTADCRTVFFSTLLSIAVLPLFLLSSKNTWGVFQKPWLLLSHSLTPYCCECRYCLVFKWCQEVMPLDCRVAMWAIFSFLFLFPTFFPEILCSHWFLRVHILFLALHSSSSPSFPEDTTLG